MRSHLTTVLTQSNNPPRSFEPAEFTSLSSCTCRSAAVFSRSGPGRLPRSRCRVFRHVTTATPYPRPRRRAGTGYGPEWMRPAGDVPMGLPVRSAGAISQPDAVSSRIRPPGGLAMREHRASPSFLTHLILLLPRVAYRHRWGTRADNGEIHPPATASRPYRCHAPYPPSAVTIFEDIRRYFDRRGMSVDYVLFSHYDASGRGALERGEVDIAWNTPLAHAQYHRKAGNASRALGDARRQLRCPTRRSSFGQTTSIRSTKWAWRARRWYSVAAKPPSKVGAPG